MARTTLGRLAAGQGRVEPLLVHRIGTSDTLAAMWEVCAVKDRLQNGIPAILDVYQRLHSNDRAIRRHVRTCGILVKSPAPAALICKFI